MLRRLTAFLLFAMAIPAFTDAQQKTDYPEDYLTPAFHAGRRAAVKEMMPAKSVAIFFASQVRNRNNDVDYIFAQNKNFYYLTGLDEPNAMLLLFKEPVTINDKTGTEFIFVQPRNPSREMWTGKILGAEGVRERYKLDNVFTHEQFNTNTLDLGKVDTVLTSFRNENIIAKYYPQGRGGTQMDPLSRMASVVDSLLTATGKPFRSPARILSTLRSVKQPEEIVLITKATEMSAEGHTAVMKAAKPGMTEYQAQAVMEYYFKKNGSEYPGYPSINGSAENSCVLHYETNQRLMKDGDLLLSDCAAEYHGYSSDVTRTIPVNGKFTPEQKAIYEIVLEAQDSAFVLCKPGSASNEPHMAAQRVIARGLAKLGIITDANDNTQVRTYFPHGTSHGLGLDVHDPNPARLVPGAIFTVEPGIYIAPGSKCDKKWWNIGVRIEDDILITADGHKNLSAGAPRTVADVEKAMKQKSIFD
ncbi:M24 family metallopeptidase [Sediminibacterium roseum]|uniref:Xaa-Pro aminopeptidase n=1 Tax=Sediminibacterium roseum TaxID=1978412 RepID=A0ABW9ZR10_9BACT|nr:aminopeptidase P N-terminal domain-containing protein [Sediminibacterium roseum]NCI48960.1 M24 family metallopeptidase [Sediminibacterium roseum]